jgi:serine/threonine protein kinase
MKHENIVRMFEAFETDTRFIIRMEYARQKDYFAYKLIENCMPFNTKKPDGGVAKLRQICSGIFSAL